MKNFNPSLRLSNMITLLSMKASLLCVCIALSLGFVASLSFGAGTASAHALFSCADNDVLCSNQTITINRYIISNNGVYKLIMQADGNLVLYNLQSGRALWATNTAGSSARYVIMQADGNFVLYNASNRPLWASNTGGHPNDFIIVQNDGNVVIYDGRPIWATGTAGR